MDNILAKSSDYDWATGAGSGIYQFDLIYSQRIMVYYEHQTLACG